ncbi:MAG: type I-C CRISPR-associated endonuclease Cas1c [bacterium]|jgi:CRISPR-associated protein Cas1
MKKLLNILYITLQGAYLHLKGETISVRLKKETKLRIPMHTLQGIVCLGRVSCSPFLMGACGARNILISFHSEQGRFLARVQGPVSGNVLLRRQQYRTADGMLSSAVIARNIILAKLANGRNVLMRANRELSAPDPLLIQASQQLSKLISPLKDCSDLEMIRGIEGRAAAVYFGVFNELILQQKDQFQFHERSRRPPLDNINALLSFLYTLLVHDVSSALESVGLDPAVGFLHRDRPGRPGLALDMMEEFRACIVDRLALTLINRQQIKGSNFIRTETGAIRMSDDTRKSVISAYQKRKQEEILHPYLGEKVAIGLLPFVQAQLLARFLRGDLKEYPPFVWR